MRVVAEPTRGNRVLVPRVALAGKAGFMSLGDRKMKQIKRGYPWSFSKRVVATAALMISMLPQTALAGRAQRTALPKDSSAVAVPLSDDCARNAAPKADFFVKEAAFTGEQLNLSGITSDDPDGTISAYSWDFGDGVSAQGRDVTHSFANPGVYEIKLTVSDSCNAASESQMTVRTYAAPTGIIRHSIPLYSSYSPTYEYISFHAEGVDDPGAFYVWNYTLPSGQTGTGYGNYWSSAFSSAGSVTLQLTVYDSMNQGASVIAQDSLMLEITDRPRLNVTAPQGTTAGGGIAVVGDTAWLASNYEPGITTLDLSDPNAPVLIASTTPNGTALFDLKAAQGLIVGAAKSKGILVFDAADPQVSDGSSLVRTFDTQATFQQPALGLAAIGRMVYATSSTGIFILDLYGSDPQAWSISHMALGNTNRVIAAGYGRLFVGGDNGYWVLDVTNPAAPLNRGFVTLTGTPSAMALQLKAASADLIVAHLQTAPKLKTVTSFFSFARDDLATLPASRGEQTFGGAGSYASIVRSMTFERPNLLAIASGEVTRHYLTDTGDPNNYRLSDTAGIYGGFAVTGAETQIFALGDRQVLIGSEDAPLQIKGNER